MSGACIIPFAQLQERIVLGKLRKEADMFAMT